MKVVLKASDSTRWAGMSSSSMVFDRSPSYSQQTADAGNRGHTAEVKPQGTLGIRPGTLRATEPD